MYWPFMLLPWHEWFFFAHYFFRRPSAVPSQTLILGNRSVTLYRTPRCRPNSPAVYTHLPPHEAAPLADLLAAHALLLVAVDEPDWETHFSPWPAPKVFKGSADFGGLADAYLGTLTHEIVPAAEAAAGIAPQWRGLAGYSLAGLLSVYAPYQTDIFSRTASVSGSLWFDGLADFLQHAPPTLPERAYFSIGDREKNSKNPRLACVETRTQAAHQLMQARGASSILELNPGGHFEHVPARMARAVEWLLA